MTFALVPFSYLVFKCCCNALTSFLCCSPRLRRGMLKFEIFPMSWNIDESKNHQYFKDTNVNISFHNLGVQHSIEVLALQQNLNMSLPVGKFQPLSGVYPSETVVHIVVITSNSDLNRQNVFSWICIDGMTGASPGISSLFLK